LRSTADFNAFYQNAPDPWGVARAERRDRALSRIIKPHIEGKSVLELGCGEGHLTATVFRPAKFVKGVDISTIAVERATTLHLPNAAFEAQDFLDVTFAGYDVIAAIECLYYLTPNEQEAFLRKLRSEHAGTFIVSGPIIGKNEHRTYFTHNGLLSTFARHGLSVIEWSNLNVYRREGLGGLVAAVATRLSDDALPWVPERYVFQRCYVLQ
jgi:2-polyprenyl-3-methyl-5-hydroxy-6-metoxy-1,4-benzoquinol methylase